MKKKVLLMCAVFAAAMVTVAVAQNLDAKTCDKAKTECCANKKDCKKATCEQSADCKKECATKACADKKAACTKDSKSACTKK